jgi:hypothetical protein
MPTPPRQRTFPEAFLFLPHLDYVSRVKGIKAPAPLRHQLTCLCAKLLLDDDHRDAISTITSCLTAIQSAELRNVTAGDRIATRDHDNGNCAGRRLGCAYTA